MSEILTEVNSKEQVIVGSGWINFINNLETDCEDCGKLITKEEPIFNSDIGPVCKACHDKNSK